MVIQTVFLNKPQFYGLLCSKCYHIYLVEVHYITHVHAYERVEQLSYWNGDFRGSYKSKRLGLELTKVNEERHLFT